MKRYFQSSDIESYTRNRITNFVTTSMVSLFTIAIPVRTSFSRAGTIRGESGVF